MKKPVLFLLIAAVFVVGGMLITTQGVNAAQSLFIFNISRNNNLPYIGPAYLSVVKEGAWQTFPITSLPKQITVEASKVNMQYRVTSEVYVDIFKQTAKAGVPANIVLKKKP